MTTTTERSNKHQRKLVSVDEIYRRSCCSCVVVLVYVNVLRLMFKFPEGFPKYTKCDHRAIKTRNRENLYIKPN